MASSSATEFSPPLPPGYTPHQAGYPPPQAGYYSAFPQNPPGFLSSSSLPQGFGASSLTQQSIPDSTPQVNPYEKRPQSCCNQLVKWIASALLVVSVAVAVISIIALAGGSVACAGSALLTGPALWALIGAAAAGVVSIAVLTARSSCNKSRDAALLKTSQQPSSPSIQHNPMFLNGFYRGLSAANMNVSRLFFSIGQIQPGQQPSQEQIEGYKQACADIQASIGSYFTQPQPAYRIPQPPQPETFATSSPDASHNRPVPPVIAESKGASCLSGFGSFLKSTEPVIVIAAIVSIIAGALIASGVLAICGAGTITGLIVVGAAGAVLVTIIAIRTIPCSSRCCCKRLHVSVANSPRLGKDLDFSETSETVKPSFCSRFKFRFRSLFTREDVERSVPTPTCEQPTLSA